MSDESGPTTRPLYINHTGLRGSAFDIALDVGYRDGEDPPELYAKIVMSWEHAALVVKLLQEQIDKYRETVGDIPDVTKVGEGDAA